MIRLISSSHMFSKLFGSNSCTSIIRQQFTVKKSTIQHRTMGTRDMPSLKQFQKAAKDAKKDIPIEKSRFEYWSERVVSDEYRDKVFIGVMSAAVSFIGVGFFFQAMRPIQLVKRYGEKNTEGKYKVEPQTFIEAEGYSPNFIPNNKELVNLYSECGARAGLTVGEYEKTSVFHTYMLDPVNIGNTFFLDGLHIGVPRHMTWTSVEETDLSSISITPFYNPLFDGFKIPVDRIDPDLLQQLKESFVMSSGARKFMMSYLMSQNSRHYGQHVLIALPGIMLILHYIFGLLMNSKQGLMEQKRFYRLGLQSLLLVICVGMALYSYNDIRSILNSNAMERVIRTPEEADDAIEFFEKCLERNRLLRKVIGKEAEYYIEEDGNIVPTFYEFSQAVNYSAQLEIVKGIKDRLEAYEKAKAKVQAEVEKGEFS
eukprot:TRINITY_DN8294_c0_g1_i2.p1 TRINITY_DN8294_c0_g1~~TRINITY_DN8294_c0_g1_i2.p1  ORF type:complete len:427 (-),score=44.72 TRINITY_DN8294_c0_g1_i2:217-1497(-)